MAVLEANLIAHVVFAHAHAAWRWIVGFGHVGPAHVFDAGDVCIDLDEVLRGAERSMQLRQPAAQAPPDAERGDFNGEHIRVTIHDKATEAVAV